MENKKIKILMIDDDRAFLKLIKLNLEETGKFAVRTEDKGSVGLAAAMVFNPDLILLDVVMGDEDGTYVASKLRNNIKTNHIPVIYLTAIVGKEETVPEEFLGRYEVLAKPISTDALVLAIESRLKKDK